MEMPTMTDHLDDVATHFAFQPHYLCEDCMPAIANSPTKLLAKERPATSSGAVKIANDRASDQGGDEPQKRECERRYQTKKRDGQCQGQHADVTCSNAPSPHGEAH